MCKKIVEVCRIGYKSGRKEPKLFQVKRTRKGAILINMHVIELEIEKEGLLQNDQLFEEATLEIRASHPINRRSHEKKERLFWREVSAGEIQVLHLETSSIPFCSSLSVHRSPEDFGHPQKGSHRRQSSQLP